MAKSMDESKRNTGKYGWLEEHLNLYLVVHNQAPTPQGVMVIVKQKLFGIEEILLAFIELFLAVCILCIFT